MHFTEAHFENAILELMHDKLGYDRIYGPDVERDYTEPLHLEIVRQSLFDINPSLAKEAIDEAIVKIRNIENGSLVQRNEVFTDYMQNGVEVNYFDGKDQCSTRVRLIDYDTPLRNNFTVANQWTVEEKSVRRADIIVFVNGFPLVPLPPGPPGPAVCQKGDREAAAVFRSHLPGSGGHGSGKAGCEGKSGPLHQRL